MACENCNFKGYLETSIAKDAKMKPMIAKCPRCKDTAAYSEKIKSLMKGEVEEPSREIQTHARQSKKSLATILPFPRKRE